MSNIAAELAGLARRRGWLQRPAYLTAERAWSHGEVHDLAARAGSVLARRGLRPGDRVMLALPDGIDWIVAFLAAARVGAVAVLVNPELPAADHRRLQAESTPRLAISAEELREHFDVAWQDGAELRDRAAREPAAAPVAVGRDAPLYVQFTSGTTGTPKGAEHRHGDIAAYHRAVGRDVLMVRAVDVSLSVSKLFFAYGFGNSFVYPLCSGSAAVLIAERPTPGRVRELIERHRVTILHAVPSAYANLVAEAGSGVLRSPRVAVSAGEPLAPAVREGARALLGCALLDELGSTEVGGAFCSNTVACDLPGTVGRPLAGYEIELRDETAQPVDEGELWVRGPTIMTRYVGRPAETADVLRDGWLRTGDRAVRRSDGAYELRGRVDDLELVGGITMSPIEVERVLLEHAAVAEVAVAAVPDRRGATKLRAFVVPAKHAGADAALEDELLALARRTLAPFKVPRSVRLVDRLPRTPTGKLRRFVLRSGV